MRRIRISTSVVLAIGLLAGSGLGVGAQDEPDEAIAPTRVSGSITYAPRPCTEPEVEQDAAVRRERNGVCSPMTWRASDPRLSGTVTLVESHDVYQLGDGVVSVGVVAEFLSNDEGGWACSDSGNLYEGDGDAGTYVGTPTSTCIGRDGYEGLSAILVFDIVDLAFEGLIFPGDVPPVPEQPTTE